MMNALKPYIDCVTSNTKKRILAMKEYLEYTQAEKIAIKKKIIDDLNSVYAREMPYTKTELRELGKTAKLKYSELPRDEHGQRSYQYNSFYYDDADTELNEYVLSSIIKKITKFLPTRGGGGFRGRRGRGSLRGHKRIDTNVDHKVKTDEDNIEETFNKIVDRLHMYGIEIYDVKMNVEQYWNRSASSLCGNCNTFNFCCRKNMYKFNVSFSDDCDCDPGTLMVHNLENEKTGQEINMYCDLFAQNTGKLVRANFILLLNCTTEFEFVMRYWSKYDNLIHLLRKRGYEIEIPEDDKPENREIKELSTTDISGKYINSILTSFSHYHFGFTVKDWCYVEKYPDDEMDVYYIGPITQNNIQEYETYYSRAFKVQYTDDNDMDKFVKCMCDNYNVNHGLYGYYDVTTDTWHNGREITEYIATLSQNYATTDYEDKVLLFKNQEDTIYCPNNMNLSKIDYTIYIKFIHMNGMLSNKLPRFKNEYVIDFYKMHLTYDKQKKDTSCKLEITGNYHDISFKHYYHEHKEKFNENPEKFINKTHLDPILLEGTYNEMFDYIKLFCNTVLTCDQTLSTETKDSAITETEVKD